MFKINDILTYTAFDEESYSRGYGIQYETKTSRVIEVRFKTDGHHYDIGEANILSENKRPVEGETIRIEFWDGEEGRSYGWGKAIKDCKVTELLYVMENRDRIRQTDIKQVKG
jgi:hypothetical protein